MEVQFKVKRFTPGKKSYIQTFKLEVDPKDIVLDVLLKIQGEIDPSLTMRCSCQSAICGSCTMKMNHSTYLACSTQVQHVLNKNNEILIEAPGNHKVLKDLVVDLDLFWEKINKVAPWLKPSKKPKREFLCNDQEMYELSEVSECIMCGACVSDCTVMEVDKSFLGPAALAKAYRFVADPRDSKTRERLEKISEAGGIWDCTHCFYCVEACPKRVLPMDRILSLRKLAMEAGITNNIGSRHAKAISGSVEHSGTLNEATVMPKSYGWWNIPKLLGLVPVGVRMFRKGKLPSLIHPKLSSVNHVKRLFNKLRH